MHVVMMNRTDRDNGSEGEGYWRTGSGKAGRQAGLFMLGKGGERLVRDVHRTRCDARLLASRSRVSFDILRGVVLFSILMIGHPGYHIFHIC